MSAKPGTCSPNKGKKIQDHSKVILKGENHASREDNEEERRLMREGIDALVLEGSEKEAEWGIFEGWFQQAMAGMFYVMSPLYISKEILVDFAILQDADLFFTRESDAELLRNAPRLVRWFSAFLYFIMLPGSVFVGLTRGYLSGAMFLFLSFGVPVLLIRVYNSKFNPPGRNRDRLMARKIQEALSDNDTVLAIVGADHADGVINALSNDVDLDYHPPKSDGLSVSVIWDFTVRAFQMFSLLFFLYLVVLWVSVNFLLPLA